MILKHQYSSAGSHRIVELDTSGFLKVSSDWVGYNNIASYTKGGVTYIAVTEYFAGGSMEPDKIYQLTETEYKSENPVHNN